MMQQELVLKEITEFLHTHYPDASIGISGSMATGNCHADSDIDILFIKNKDDVSTLMKFFYKSVKVSIFSFNRTEIASDDRKYLLYYHNMPVTFISNTVILYDSNRFIGELKDYVADIMKRRVCLKEILIDELKSEIEALLQQNFVSTITEKRKCYGILSRILSIFFLRYYPDEIIQKNIGISPFSTIKQNDEFLYKELKNCIPYYEHSITRLEHLYYQHLLTY